MTARVAIVGGGFSGVMVLANLVASATTAFAIELFDSADDFAEGVAYGTDDNNHLLNVPAGRMGAFGGKPEHLYEWLQSPPGIAAVARLWPGRAITAESFVPRVLYNAYLRHCLDEALALAAQKGIEVRLSRATVIDAVLDEDGSQRLLLIVARGILHEEVMVDALVLATGNLSPRRLEFQSSLIRGIEHYVPDTWNPPRGSAFPDRVGEFSADSNIVIVGSGLTMVDAVLTLQARNYPGRITALSRNGWLPAVHKLAEPYPAWEWLEDPGAAPTKVLDMLLRLRREVAEAAKKGHDWRAVIDSLRPITPNLWERLSIAEKRKFMRRLFTLWNVHRHRIAPDAHEVLQRMKDRGALQVLAGRIYYVGAQGDGLAITYRTRGSEEVEHIHAAMLLNCTGPALDIAAAEHGLLHHLRDRGLITVGPLRAGIELTHNGTARGRAEDAIFPIGTLLVGELLECTAVPELREHAQRVASRVLKRVGKIS